MLFARLVKGFNYMRNAILLITCLILREIEVAMLLAQRTHLTLESIIKSVNHLAMTIHKKVDISFMMPIYRVTTSNPALMA